MLARLILVLLAFVFATPVATAACHAQTAGHHATAPSHHGSAPVERDDKAVAATACIGCVPPSNWMSARVGEPVVGSALRVSDRVPALTIGRGAPPALPPPRTW